MLLNDLYKFTRVLHKEGEGYVVETEMNPTHRIFDGHFPSSPVLPGVCLMQMVVDAVSEVLDKKVQVHEGIDLKFTTVVDPREGQQLSVHLTISEVADELVKVTSSTIFNGQVCFKFKGLLR